MDVANTTVTEASGAQASFVVSLAAPTNEPVTVEYTTVDGTAEAGTDYVPVSGTLTLAPGTTAADNDFPANWCPSTSTIPSGTDHGTPGQANDPCPP